MNKSNVDFTKRYIPYNKIDVEKYLKDLRLVGSLSALFSDSEIPLLHYRATENLYCADFNATNLARADVSADAKLKSKGIGIKTFVEGNQRTLQKIAEFNAQRELYSTLTGIDLIIKVAELRNKRLEFTQKAYGLTDMLYHCIVRSQKCFYLFEEKMDYIDISNIKIISSNKHTILFTDNIHEYKFDASKSTLYKRFVTDVYFAYVPVDILTDPIRALRSIAVDTDNQIIDFPESVVEFPESVLVPLYAQDSKGNKIIYPKSGLNQWNASGRPRDFNEVYIPFNATLRSMYDGFFPARDTPFEVELPDGKIMSMKICQDNGKAIMSNPNKELGQWLLRDVLNIPEGQVITYEMLLEIGIDSVCFQKVQEGKYKLDFRKVGDFESFMNKEYMEDVEIDADTEE